MVLEEEATALEATAATAVSRVVAASMEARAESLEVEDSVRTAVARARAASGSAVAVALAVMEEGVQKAALADSVEQAEQVAEMEEEDLGEAVTVVVMAAVLAAGRELCWAGEVAEMEEVEAMVEVVTEVVTEVVMEAVMVAVE